MLADRTLRLCLQGLVLLNLVFVQLTEAASPAWLAPLYLLALCEPLLARLRERLWYRGVWNAAVLWVFALLLRHAVGEDLRFVLQDGLLLAALCQVHLLNNLRADQRPDLLFLNSFLIAIVTGYLCRDLVYPVAFLAYVPLFIVALELQCFAREGRELAPEGSALARGGSALARGATRRVVRDGLRRSGLLLGATLAVFALWPRDFERRGFLLAEFDFSSSGGGHDVGFTNKLQLQRKGNARSSDRVVMTVALKAGLPAGVPELWRGATLGATNGEEWWPLSESELALAAGADAAWVLRGERWVRARASDPDGAGSAVRLEVSSTDPQTSALFAPLAARELALSPGGDALQVRAQVDATLRYGANAVRPTVQYELVCDTRPVELGGAIPDSGSQLGRYTALPASTKLAAARELAAALAERAGPDVAQHELAAAFAEYLGARYTYLPPGAEGAAQSLEQFLKGDSGGHCEFFASALAAMLRTQGIACRIATGYRSNEWDGAGRVLTFRRHDAHAWVEVLDPLGGWYALDATPALAPEDGPGPWGRMQAVLASAWTQVAGFDLERRAALFAWIGRLPSRAAAALRAEPAACAAGVLALALAALGLAASGRARRARRTPAAVRRYRAALARAGMASAPGETPRELLARAEAQAPAPPGLAELALATRAHELARYALQPATSNERPAAASVDW